MKLTLQIERRTGPTKHGVKNDGRVAGIPCPGCGSDPFFIATHPAAPDGRYGARCRACNDPVGWLTVTSGSLFGAKEDSAVVHGRARVY